MTERREYVSTYTECDINCNSEEQYKEEQSKPNNIPIILFSVKLSVFPLVLLF